MVKVLPKQWRLQEYAERLGGMYPEDMVEAGKVDQVVVAVENINALLSPSMREDDPIKKKAMRAELSC